MKKGLQSLNDDLEDTVGGINDFIKSLNKALKDLKEVSIKPEVQTVSSSSKKVVAPASGTVKTAAASTLFSLLSGSAGAQKQVPAATNASVVPAIGIPPKKGGPPKAPVSGGPPKRPATSGPPKAPVAGGPPKRANLPPAPKLPPTSGGPPKAPSAGVVQAPSFAKRPMPPAGTPPRPAAPVAGTPPRPAAPVAAASAGGGLSSLRDEMLEELNRLKKIMRGE